MPIPSDPHAHAHDHSRPEHITEGHRTHHFSPAHAARLVSEERQQTLPAKEILRAAGVGPGHHVVDLGAGPGFFTLPAAELVGPTGRVYAIDVQPPLLEMLQRRAADAGITGIETIHSQESRIPLPDSTADRVFIAYVLHEADDPTALLREAARLLRPGGEVIVVDIPKVEGTPGPPLHHRISVEELTTLAAAANLHPQPSAPQAGNYYLVRLARR